MNKHFSKEDIKMTNKHKKRCPASLIVREIQSKTTVRCHFTFISIVVVFFFFNFLSFGNYVEDLEGLYTVGTRWDCKMVQPLWKTRCKFLKNLKIHLPYDLEIPLRDMYAEGWKAGTETDICAP